MPRKRRNRRIDRAFNDLQKRIDATRFIDSSIRRSAFLAPSVRPAVRSLVKREVSRIVRRPDNLRRRVSYVARRLIEPVREFVRHDCRREYSKVLSWRASRGSGTRRRSQRELSNNRRDFKRKDC